MLHTLIDFTTDLFAAPARTARLMVVTIAGAPVIAYVLASVRLVAWLLVAPPFSSKAVPTLAKTLLALGMAFAVVPGMARRGPRGHRRR